MIGPVVPLAEGTAEVEAKEGESEDGVEAKKIGKALRSRGKMSAGAKLVLVG